MEGVPINEGECYCSIAGIIFVFFPFFLEWNWQWLTCLFWMFFILILIFFFFCKMDSCVHACHCVMQWTHVCGDLGYVVMGLHFFFHVGLFLTYLALFLMDGHGQPALLYLVPCTLGKYMHRSFSTQSWIVFILSICFLSHCKWRLPCISRSRAYCYTWLV